MKHLINIISEKYYDELPSLGEDGVIEEHDRLLQHYHEKLKSHPNYSHVTGYQVSSSVMNESLWNHHSRGTTIPNYVKDKEQSLNTLLHSMKSPHDLHVWSGTYKNPAMNLDHKGIAHHPAFLSTSLDPGVAKGFGTNHYISSPGKYGQGGKETNLKHIMKIHIPAGSPGAYIARPSGEPYNSEKEFLLPSGANLKHIGSESVKSDMYTGHSKYNIRVHHFELQPYKNKYSK